MLPPEELTAIATGNLSSTFLLIAININVFSTLSNNKLTIDELANELNIPINSCRVLVQYLVNLNLLEYKKNLVFNNVLSKKYLVDNKESIQLIKWLYGYGTTYSELLKKIIAPQEQPWYAMMKTLQPYYKNSVSNNIDEGFYTDAHNLRIIWGKELADQYDFSKHKVLLDLGAACGGWTIGILNKNPNLLGVIFERKEILSLVKRIVNVHIESKRIVIHGGDFFKDTLPLDCDVILVANVIHDWNYDDGLLLLTKIYNSMKKNSTLLMKEFFFEDNWKNSNYAAVQAYLVLGSKFQSGWQPTYSEAKKMLSLAGFKKIIKRKNLLIAHKI